MRITTVAGGSLVRLDFEVLLRGGGPGDRHHDIHRQCQSRNGLELMSWTAATGQRRTYYSRPEKHIIPVVRVVVTKYKAYMEWDPLY